ncbi:hypothetical protein POMI540_0311 [Schizosaccharomyces pombe]
MKGFVVISRFILTLFILITPGLAGVVNYAENSEWNVPKYGNVLDSNRQGQKPVTFFGSVTEHVSNSWWIKLYDYMMTFISGEKLCMQNVAYEFEDISLCMDVVGSKCIPTLQSTDIEKVVNSTSAYLENSESDLTLGCFQIQRFQEESTLYIRALKSSEPVSCDTVRCNHFNHIPYV